MEALNFHAMNCAMTAVLDGDRRPLAQVPQWFTQWEAELSRFRPESGLCQLNRHSGEPVVVSDLLWTVVQIALRTAAWTDGLVTPTILGALEAAGYDRSFDLIQPTQGSQSAPVGNWREIQCNPVAQTIHLPAHGRLDLGGIAKGWAAGVAVQRLGQYGPALVDAGGDMAVSGPRRDGSPWPIEAPDGSLLLLHRGAIATSGRDYRHWGAVGQHHLLDPRTGQPAQTEILTATVIAPEAWQAEASAKVVLLLGNLDWLEQRPELAGLVVRGDGRIQHSQRLAPYLWREQ